MEVPTPAPNSRRRTAAGRRAWQTRAEGRGNAADGVFPRSPQASWWSPDEGQSGAVSSPERA